MRSSLGLGLLLVLAVLLIQASSAFPLTGGNGVVNATVYGAILSSDALVVDMSVSMSDSYVVEVIDSEDRAYKGNNKLGGDSADVVYSAYNGLVRDMVGFNVPKSAEIKRIKVIPEESDPFIIEWSGVPEASGSGILLKFYGANRDSERLYYTYVWTFDIKVTNTNSSILSFNTNEILMRDKTGWVYGPSFWHKIGETKKLLPGESVRFPLQIRNVCEFSRPSEIIFRDLVMNIEAWT